jgi:eukaryotic-like serine/threonine-protein kinase
LAAQDQRDGDSTPRVRPGALTALLREIAADPSRLSDISGGGLYAGSVIGRFELIRELGRGGFGIVWEARDRELGRRVAFKLVRPGDERNLREERLLREAEAAARLAHPNIVAVFDVGRSDHGPYLVLELLEGITLEARLARGFLPGREALRLACEVSKALAHAHSHGVVHRDLKPANVFLCDDGQVKVLDFGMAHAFGRARILGGTPAYMAPEQRRGAPEDERTDVFALGVILYEMLTGRPPFPHVETSSRAGRSPPVPQVPGAPRLGNLVLRMLRHDPVKRPRDGGEVLRAMTALREDLDRALEGGPARVRRHRKQRGPVGTATRSPHGSVVVLPFVNVSTDPDEEHFSDGLTEEILNALARVDGLRVPGRTSSFFFKGKRVTLADVGRALDVGAVLEGSVRRSGDRLRVTARMVNVRDGFQLWSETYDRQLTDIFAVQDEIAAAVVGALRLRLERSARKIAGRRRSAHPEAYTQYLLGQQFINRLTHKDDLRAVSAFEKAVEIEPGFAPAWAALANAIHRVADFAKTSAAVADGFDRALAAAERAIALDPNLVDGLVVRGYLRTRLLWDWMGARVDFERALEVSPANPEAHRGYARHLLAPLGALDEGISHLRKAIEIDPLSPRAWSNLGALSTFRGDLDEAKTALNRSLEIAPDQMYAHGVLGIVLLLEGRPAEALEVFERSTEEEFRLRGSALAHYDLGDDASSRRDLDRLIEECATHAAIQVASVFAWRGELEQAFAWVDRARAQRDPGLPDIAVDPLFRKVRDDARYQAALRALNLPPVEVAH